MNIIQQRIAQSLGISVSNEDNSQVEVNFHIDTEKDGAPVADELAEDAQEVAEASVEVEEGVDEVEKSEDEMQELQEAQDSLESLGICLNKHYSDGTITRPSLEMYRLGLQAIVGQETLDTLNMPSMETYGQTKLQGAMYCMETQQLLESTLDQVSMEGIGNWLKKLRYSISKFINFEKALLKRAIGLKKIAETSANEHASNDTIAVNNKKGLRIPYLLSIPWSTAEEFENKTQDFITIYKDINEVRGGYDDEYVDNMFPTSNNWSKDKNGNKSLYIFGLKLVRKDTILSYEAVKVEQVTDVPNLPPAICSNVLTDVISLLQKKNIIYDNIQRIADVYERNKVVEKDVVTSTTKSDKVTVNDDLEIVDEGQDITTTTTKENVTEDQEAKEMINTLLNLAKIRNTVLEEVLNYINYSLTDREFN